MTDKELIEGAAKAAGIELQTRPMFGGDAEPGFYEYSSGKPAWRFWDPLDDDGDALRLAVKLRMEVGWESGDVVFADGNCSEPCGQDPAAATRRAIVRAAAALAPQGVPE